MTSGQPGAMTIIMALAMTILSGGAFTLAALGRKHLFELGKRAYFVQVFLALAATVYLYILLFNHDYSIAYIYSYSSNDLPFHFLLSSFWAGQEGTYLLWFVLSSVFGLLLMYRAGKYKYAAMAFFSLINLFLAVMLAIVSPFKPLEFFAMDGAGLNPLLQDYWMVIHPPVMFCAFSMAGVPFAIAMAAMAMKDYKGWINIAFPFVALTSVLFFAANVMGGFWAYRTLGWGGYWAWDPVENTSFVPWIASLALIHGMIIEKRSGALRRVNLLLGTFMLMLVVYGTFLTRSGVLADFSVHSFVDLGVNNTLIAFLLGVFVLILGLFFSRQKSDIKGQPLNYRLYSTEFILFVGMSLLFLLAVLVLFWSSLPLITMGLGITPTAADITTYNSFAFPLAIVISLFLTVSPLVLGFKKQDKEVKKVNLYLTVIPLIVAGILAALKIVSPAVAVAGFIYVAVLLIYSSEGEMARKLGISLIYGVVGIVVAMVLGVRSVHYLLFIMAALTATGAHVLILHQLIPNNLKFAGGHISHFGLGLMLVGILASSAFGTEQRLILPRDKTESAFGYDFSYHGTTAAFNSSENKILLTMRKGNEVIQAQPRIYFSDRMNGMMKRPHIVKLFGGDLYVSPLDIQQLDHSQHGLHLAKGETGKAGDYNIKFLAFDMMSHGEGGGVAVGADLEVTYNGAVDTVKPVLSTTGEGFMGEEVPLMQESGYMVKIEKVNASDGTVLLSIPGLAETGSPDQLIIDVSEKPAINLVWIGSFLIVGGLLVTFYRRNEIGGNGAAGA